MEIQAIFLELLSQNLSARGITRATQFALSNTDSGKVLFVVLLNTLETTPDALKRLHILYIIDALIKQKPPFYADMIRGKLIEIISSVSLESNHAQVKKVLSLWRHKELISAEMFAELESFCTLKHEPVSYTEKAIWKRMEDDRDRQKRSREEFWQQYPASHDLEFLNCWNKAKSLDKTDLELFKKLSNR